MKTLFGYADPLSVRPGEQVGIALSALTAGVRPWRVVRVLCGDPRPSGAGFRVQDVEGFGSGEVEVRPREVRLGSYAVAPVAADLDGFQLEVWIWPTLIRPRWNAIVSLTSDGHEAIGLGVNASGRVAVRVAGREFALDQPIVLRRWRRLILAYDAAADRLHLSDAPRPDSPGDRYVLKDADLTAEILIPAFKLDAVWVAAAPGARGPEHHFNGRIEDPVLAGSDSDLIGAWTFNDDFAVEEAPDTAGKSPPLQLIGLPTRAVRGRRWSGLHQDWRQAPEEYGAAHFHEDDISDYGWTPDLRLPVPGDLSSGLYALAVGDGDQIDYTPFFVRPPARGPRSEVAFLASTATYMAYANARVSLHEGIFNVGAENQTGYEALLRDHGELFGPSQYEHHADGSGVHFASRLRPMLNARPGGIVWSLNADTNLLNWLDHEGVTPDILTDEDLDREGAEALAGHRVLVTGTHPEYWSTRMLDALEAYLDQGGRLMYMGANGFYWRIVFHPTKPGVIELRRAEDGTRAWASEPGEYYHAFNGEYGGLWRRLGRPPNRLVGVGFAAQGFDASSHYRRVATQDERLDFIFEGVRGEVIGDYGTQGGGAAGEEIDRVDVRLGTPPHARVLATSEGHGPGMLRVKEDFLFSLPPFKDRKIRADMTYFELPNDGAVFSTGSIAFAGALAHDGFDNDIRRIAGNVLRRFRA